MVKQVEAVSVPDAHGEPREATVVERRHQQRRRNSLRQDQRQPRTDRLRQRRGNDLSSLAGTGGGGRPRTAHQTLRREDAERLPRPLSLHGNPDPWQHEAGYLRGRQDGPRRNPWRGRLCTRTRLSTGMPRKRADLRAHRRTAVNRDRDDHCGRTRGPPRVSAVVRPCECGEERRRRACAIGTLAPRRRLQSTWPNMGGDTYPARLGTWTFARQCRVLAAAGQRY